MFKINYNFDEVYCFSIGLEQLKRRALYAYYSISLETDVENIAYFSIWLSPRAKWL